MTTRTTRKRRIGFGRRGGGRLALLGLMLLGVGLGLGRGLSPRDEASLAGHSIYPARSYTVVWGPHSFDEAIWRAVEWVANVKDSVAQHVDRFQVQIRYTSDDYPPITVAFDRADLELLAAGTLAPEDFIRERVEFR